MSLLGDLGGQISYGGGSSANGSVGWSSTDAASARAWSEQQATVAYERQRQLMQDQMAYNSAEAALARQFNAEEALKARTFNSQEAEKSRNWETDMANTIYTRSVKNLREAGINPILAYNMGLSGASVGSGATASGMGATGSPASSGLGSAPLAQNFMDSSSANQGWGSGSNYSYSESGLATGLRQMGALIDETLAALGSGQTINSLLGIAGDTVKNFYDDLMGILTKKNGTSTVHKGKVDADTGLYGRYHGGSHGTF